MSDLGKHTEYKHGNKIKNKCYHTKTTQNKKQMLATATITHKKNSIWQQFPKHTNMLKYVLDAEVWMQINVCNCIQWGRQVTQQSRAEQAGSSTTAIAAETPAC